MHIEGKYKFMCDMCGAEMDYSEKYNIEYRRHYKDTTYKVACCYSSVSIIAFDLCINCIEKVETVLRGASITNVTYTPLAILNDKYVKRVCNAKSKD